MLHIQVLRVMQTEAAWHAHGSLPLQKEATLADVRSSE